MKKILTIIGARPQFIKASVVSRAIIETSSLQEVVVHTGQHFDSNMSAIFFHQLSIPEPSYLLDINRGNHGDMTGRMLIEIEEKILKEKPDFVMVYGDTNSTLAGALAASKLHIPVIHIEAGLRSFNMNMPEEINRILTDRVSDLLFCPTQTAINNLKNESFPYLTPRNKLQTIALVGDVMQDCACLFSNQALAPQSVDPSIENFILVTIHRAENTDDPHRLSEIFRALTQLSYSHLLVIPLHPRTRKFIELTGIDTSNLRIIDPVGYLEMLWLLSKSSLILTDSGGVQKEAFFMGKPCVTMRDQTEWIELIEAGANELVGANSELIIDAVKRNFGRSVSDPNNLYGGGTASNKIVETILEA